MHNSVTSKRKSLLPIRFLEVFLSFVTIAISSRPRKVRYFTIYTTNAVIIRCDQWQIILSLDNSNNAIEIDESRPSIPNLPSQNFHWFTENPWIISIELSFLFFSAKGSIISAISDLNEPEAAKWKSWDENVGHIGRNKDSRWLHSNEQLKF